MPSDEEILFPESIIGDIVIKPWSFYKLMEVSTYLKNILESLNKRGINFYEILDKEEIKYTYIFKLLSIFNDDILKIISITINKDDDDIKKLDMIIGLTIFLTIIKQNIEFIKKRTKPSEFPGRTSARRKLSIGDLFQTLVTNGHKLKDLKYNYTIGQVYLFYEKCKKEDLDSQKMEAITLANALIYASPSQDQKSLRKKNSLWTKFMESLSWDSLEKKAKSKTIGGFLGMFQKAGIPIKDDKKGDK